MSHDWRDICEGCLAVLEMPEDPLAPSNHLCPNERVPWGELASMKIVSRTAANCAVRRSSYPHASHQSFSVSEEDPEQMGPFLPWEPPRPIYVRDLLLWSRNRMILDMREMGRKSVLGLEKWLKSYGLELAKENASLLQRWLGAVGRARAELLGINYVSLLAGRVDPYRSHLERLVSVDRSLMRRAQRYSAPYGR